MMRQERTRAGRRIDSRGVAGKAELCVGGTLETGHGTRLLCKDVESE